MSQPRFRFATDATYTSGADAGLSNKIAPSAGRRATGWKRDDLLPAAVQNYLLDQLGYGIETLADGYAFSWSGTHNIETTAASLIAAIQADTVPIAARFILTAGDATSTPVLLYTDTSNGRVAYSSDPQGDMQFWDMTTSGLSACKNAFAGSTGGVDYVVLWDPVSGNIKKMSQLGTWAAAGTTPASPNATEVGGIWFPNTGRFFLTHQAGIFYSDTLANAAWTALAMPGLGVPKSAAAGSDGIIIAKDSAEVDYSHDGTGFAAVVGAPASVLKSVDFSETNQTWVGVGANNHVYTAPLGASPWTDRGAIQPSITINRVRAFGRQYVAGGSLGELYVSPDAVTWERATTLTSSVLAGLGAHVDAIVNMSGRLVAISMITGGTIITRTTPCSRF